MVNDEIGWTDRVDALWITAKCFDCVSHRGEVNNSWDTTANTE
jgi:hypothetical protein